MRWVRLEGWLAWPAHTLGAVCRAPRQCPALAPSRSRHGSWFVAFLYLTVHNCPSCTCTAVIFSLMTKW